jgi:hypothetical protein
MHKPLSVFGMLICCVACFVSRARAADTVQVVPERALPGAQQPQLAVSPSGKVYLVFGAGSAVFCTVSGDGGKSYGEPVKVGAVGALALGMRRGPRVAATDRAVVVTAVGGRVGRGRDEDLLAWRSADGGQTWQGPVTINRVPASAREGLHQTTAAPDGTVYCVWLDLRHHRTQVYGAASADGGASWRDETLIYESPDGSVCECCQPQAAYDPRGGLHVMWRNQLAGARDMYLARSGDNGQTFGRAVKLGHGTWPLNACPMDGGGLACRGDQEVVTIWMRNKEVFRCNPGRPEVSLGKGEQGWAAAGPGGVYLVWVVGRPGPVMALRPGSDQPVRLAERGWDPVVAGPVNGKGPVIAAWEEGQPSAKRLRAAVLTTAR